MILCLIYCYHEFFSRYMIKDRLKFAVLKGVYFADFQEYNW